jgi:hypothetical protein
VGSGSFLSPPRRSARWWSLLPVLLVVAVLLVWAAVRTSGTGSPATQPSTDPDVVISATGVAPAAPTTSATEPLRLVAGAKTVDGMQAEFPRTTVGAVSAAIEYWTQLGSTLDPDRAHKIGERIAVRSWKTAGDDLAQGPVSTRRQLGLPPHGALPADASVSLGPVAYQLRDPRDDRVTVLVLAYLITTTPTAGTQSRLGVFPAPLRWDDGDWRSEQGQGTADYRSLEAPPGTAQAAAAGWLDFIQ